MQDRADATDAVVLLTAGPRLRCWTRLAPAARAREDRLPGVDEAGWVWWRTLSAQRRRWLLLRVCMGEIMDLFDLSGKTAVVTGGSRGIGLMIARGLLEAGARVYISSRKADACAAAERELTRYGMVAAVPADLSAEAGCLRLAEE